MSAREAILDKVRRAVAAGDTRKRREAVATRISGRVQAAPVPEAAQTKGEARIAQFAAKAEAADATVERVADWTDLPAALAAQLRLRNLPAAIRTGDEPRFRDLDWGGLETSRGPGRMEEPATLSLAPFAMAETGTLALASGPDNPVTLTFLGETHFAAVARDTIKAGFEDLWAAWREAGLDPRTVNLVTGPSRSADIGQTLQLGAHGPVALHVFVVG